MSFNVSTFDVSQFDAILSRGLSSGLGQRSGQMCIEAAICTVLGLPHSDDPKCVTASVRSFKMDLNDANWSSPKARALGLRDLGLAQLGSLGVVDGREFTRRIAERTINIILPKLFRSVFPSNQVMLEHADNCEKLGTTDAAAAAHADAYAAHADAHAVAHAVAHAAYTAACVFAAAAACAFAADAAAADAADAAACAADAAAADADAADAGDFYLILSANIALDVLKELDSPGCRLLTRDQYD